jgi:hypothetical protein
VAWCRSPASSEARWTSRRFGATATAEIESAPAREAWRFDPR